MNNMSNMTNKDSIDNHLKRLKDKSLSDEDFDATIRDILWNVSCIEYKYISNIRQEQLKIDNLTVKELLKMVWKRLIR